MLKALELVGFKSFADKTRLEFPAGITVIVGPNGSGKSNIVDAIKWVLGEQSAKSLRGRDMADVIFKGGGAGGRKPMHAAEATLVFDNAARDLAFDAEEVCVTRRVYRSGEGEYLLNGQACRLRDIKDLFRGTGVGADAYSIIEQGKLDVLLQASARDRRAIFEEAAGISRFKAKKIEAQRRLERVEQNMLRLSDIVEEVENRFRTVRSQAAKAQRYREYSDRLQQLRTHVGQSDWRRLTEALAAHDGELARLDREMGALGERLAAAERQTSELEAELALATRNQREHEIAAGRLRERIVALESSNDHQRARQQDFEAEAHRLQSAIAESRARKEDATARVRELDAELQRAIAQHESAQRQREACQAAARQQEADFAATREEIHSRRAAHGEAVRATVELSASARETETRMAAADAAIERTQRQFALLDEALANHRREIESLQDEAKRRAAEARACDAAAEDAQAAADAAQRQLDQLGAKLAEVLTLHSAARERAALLEDLDARHEGVSAGAQEALARAKNEPAGPFGDVCGLVADLIEVNVATAPLIDVALGDLAQYVVVKGERLFEHLQRRRERFSGRLGILPLPHASAGRESGAELDSQPGVIGRADLLVETAPWFLPLVRNLLGDTWIVEKLSHALSLRRQGARARFVTLAGELVEADGSLVIGPPRTAVGILSRRSELRALRDQIAAWDEAIATHGAEVELLRGELSERHEQARTLHRRQKEAHAAYAEQRALAQSACQQGERLEEQRQATLAELEAAQQQRIAWEQSLAATHARLEIETRRASEIATEIAEWERRAGLLEAQGRDCAAALAEAQVAFAQSDHHVSDLRRQLDRLRIDQQERGRSLEEIGQQVALCLARRQESDREVLQATGELALLYLQGEAAGRQIAAASQHGAELQQRRASLTEECQQLRRELEVRRHERHRVELAAGEVRHERNALADRLREDYGIEIAACESSGAEDEQRQREEIDEEIAQLRRKLANLGAVNLDALQEVEELEARFGKLAGQYQDLRQAKEALERIIVKINADSRRLFAETLEAIRQNFQVVFRQVFGGGRADIVLEEGADILEAGIEIVATPPGKQSLSLSLLSGGERALTAVTLMLAIFQFRPSPFCILDEVDGPLDEANIGRFLDQLKEYLSWTKFVIVTHSKKTMTAATTLYGVTMQESGVSKRVSVKFDDVSETGHIRPEALDRAATAPAAEDERAA